MKNTSSHRRPRWLWAWMIQIIEMLAVGLAASALNGLSPVACDIALWVVVPIAGAITACRAVRRGLLNYAAWLAPPVCMYATHYALWRYAPPAGAALVCAFVSLVGAAAGEVLNQREKRS